MQNIEIYKTLIATKFCTTIKTAKYSSWVVQVCIHQIQDGKQLPFEKHLKSQYLHSCFTKFDKIGHGDTMVHRADCTLMFRIFENGSGRCLKSNKKLSYRRGSVQCVVSVEILPIAMQQCRNYSYDKS